MTVCFGCNPLSKLTNELQPDHYHQYVNVLGDVTTCWHVDDRNFRDPSEAAIHLEEILDVSYEDALEYIHELPKKYYEETNG